MITSIKKSPWKILYPDIIAPITEYSPKVVTKSAIFLVNSTHFYRQTLYLSVVLGYYYLNMTIQQRFSSHRPGSSVHTMRILQTTFSVAILLATLFVAFSPKMFSRDLNAFVSGMMDPQQDEEVAVTTPQNTVRIGIVSGHWGNGDDSGAVCPDGTNEQEINLTIASLVRQKLEARGYDVDLLQEFDPRLDNYHAAVLLSIHSDTCDVIDDQATGFKVAASSYSRDQNLANRLLTCLEKRYSSTTGLQLQLHSVTVDMTDYHAFSVVNQFTTAAIIETGFLNLDREILVNRPDQVSDGILSGILCFVNNESIEMMPVPGP